jgi:hypothetical protein
LIQIKTGFASGADRTSSGEKTNVSCGSFAAHSDAKCDFANAIVTLDGGRIVGRSATRLAEGAKATS